MKKIILFALFLIVCTGCSTLNRETLLGKLQEADMTDGVSMDEAILIAQYKVILEGKEKKFNIRKYRIERSNLTTVWDVAFKEKGFMKDNWLIVYIDKKTGRVIYCSAMK